MSVGISNPPKLSDVEVDGDLDLGAHAILTTNLAIYEGSSSAWWVRNRAKNADKDLIGNNLKAVSALLSDSVLEKSAGAGVTIDGVKIKDSIPYCNTIAEKTGGSGVTIDGVKMKDSTPYCDTIVEKSTAAGVTIDGVKIKDSEIVEQGAVDTMILEKVASANIRHSHDAEAHDEATGGAGNYVLLKTITFPKGLKGILTISFSMSGGSAGVETIARIYKNGIPWGTPQTAPSDSYVLKSEDIGCDLAPGDTLELKGGFSGSANWCYVKEFRVKYDNADIGVESSNS